MSNTVEAARGSWVVFNPFSEEFKKAEEIFYELSWQRQAVVVILSMVGAIFLIVGAFPVFCWTARALKPGQDEVADKVAEVAQNINLAKTRTDTFATEEKEEIKEEVNEENIQTKEVENRESSTNASKTGGNEEPNTPQIEDEEDIKKKIVDTVDEEKKVKIPVKAPKDPLIEGLNLKDCPTALKIACGQADWELFFGEIGEEPLLPANIEDILQANCQIFPGRKVYETHILVLVPEQIDGEDLSLESIGGRVQNLKLGSGGYPCSYQRFDIGDDSDEEAKKTVTSHWVLITKEVIPDSRKLYYHEQIEKINNLADNAYAVPSLRDFVIGVFMHYVKTGEFLYPHDSSAKNPWTFTRCSALDEDNDPIVIGGFNSKGLTVVSRRDDDHQNYGMAASYKL